jgi:flagellar basal body-associated protein FliL
MAIHDIVNLNKMSKKFIKIALIAGIILGLGVGGFYFYSLSKNKKTTSDNPLVTSLTDKTKEEEVKGDTLYKDESGFSFYYPKGLIVTDITPDDGVYYSKVTLTKDEAVLTVSVLDTKEKIVDNFVKKSELIKDATLAGAAVLGGMSAKQYQTANILVTLAIDQGILYQVDGPKDGNYWEKVQGVVVDSFALGEPKSQSSTGGVDNTIYEQEEVVE